MFLLKSAAFFFLRLIDSLSSKSVLLEAGWNAAYRNPVGPSEAPSNISDVEKGDGLVENDILSDLD